MIYIKKLYLDGTPVLSPICEFSERHATPVLSWSVGGGNPDDKQVAYTLTAEIGGKTVFDSGRVETDRQSAKLDGFAFPAGAWAEITVTVESATEKTEPCDVMLFNGCLDSFPGEWITTKEDQGERVLRFNKKFTVNKPVKDAVLYYCGLGYHNATINGYSIDGVKMDPAHANYAKTCYYRVEHIYKPYMQEGTNELEIKVAPGWRKNGTDFMWQMLGERKIEFYGDSVLWAYLHITYEDGTTEDIATDTTWECALDPRTSSIFNGETFDATLNKNFDDCDKISVKTTAAPGGEMRPMILQPIVDQGYFDPKEITSPKPGTFVVDFGQNIAGVVSLELPEDMRAGQTITMVHTEELNEDGTVYTDTLRGAKQTDTYIATGDDRDLDVWMPEFTYHGFRYCQITGLDRLEPYMIDARLIHTDLENRSSFRSGSPMVNAIQEALVMTERDNMHSILTDCPQRDERMAWMNDATVRFEETPYNFDASRMFPKILQDIKNEQRAEGQFTCCSPYIYGALPADPVCSSYLVAAKEALMHYGELGAVDEFFDGMAAWEDFLLSHSPDGTVDYSYYGDWAAPAYACLSDEGAPSAVTPGVVMSTGYSYYNCKLLADFARRTGRTEAEAKYTEKAEYVRKAFLDKWFDPETGKVATGSMGCQAFALWLGILPAECEAKAAEVMRNDLVEKNYKFTTGNLNTRYMMDMLTKYGYIEDAWTVITSDEYPSFGFMFQNEATTIWERFEMKKNPGMNSH
ncbi:MAG: family 78 glycoside hydrolase catalytic domain, partial [Clostridia bacterium]|nr:family 78 glycoside hydrolase catalytic domain [Clostridia bacterium]